MRVGCTGGDGRDYRVPGLCRSCEPGIADGVSVIGCHRALVASTPTVSKARIMLPAMGGLIRTRALSLSRASYPAIRDGRSLEISTLYKRQRRDRATIGDVCRCDGSESAERQLGADAPGGINSWSSGQGCELHDQSQPEQECRGLTSGERALWCEVRRIHTGRDRVGCHPPNCLFLPGFGNVGEAVLG